MEAHKNIKLTQILDEIKEIGSLSGVVFSDREGNLIVENVDVEFEHSIFTSMCASVLESALRLGRTSGEQKLIKIIAELEHRSIMIMECDDKTFLAFFISNESNINTLLKEIDRYINKIILLHE